MSITTRRELQVPFDAVIPQLLEALKGEGFGVLTEIDMQDTLRRKLGVTGTACCAAAHRCRVTAHPDSKRAR